MDINKVSVVILNYKTWKDTLEEAKLVHDLFDLKWEQIIIVDNASPNESGEMLTQKALGDYIYIASKKNCGYAAGNNLGLKWAYEHQYRYCLVVNNDIIIEDKSLLTKLLDVFEKDENVAIVSPDIYSPDGYMFNRDSQRLTLYDFTIGYFSYKKRGRIVNDIGKYGYVYRPQGCCMMLDLDKMHSIDYMDEHTFLYYEEYILAERLLKFNWLCACALNAKIIHNHSKTVKSTFNKMKVLSMQNNSFNYYLEEYREFGWCSRRICLFFNTFKNYLTN